MARPSTRGVHARRRRRLLAAAGARRIACARGMPCWRPTSIADGQDEIVAGWRGGGGGLRSSISTRTAFPGRCRSIGHRRSRGPSWPTSTAMEGSTSSSAPVVTTRFCGTKLENPPGGDRSGSSWPESLRDGPPTLSTTVFLARGRGGMGTSFMEFFTPGAEGRTRPRANIRGPSSLHATSGSLPAGHFGRNVRRRGCPPADLGISLKKLRLEAPSARLSDDQRNPGPRPANTWLSETNVWRISEHRNPRRQFFVLAQGHL